LQNDLCCVHILKFNLINQKLKNMKTLRNKVNLIGNLGSKPEYKVLDGGQKLAKVSIATNETYKNAKGERITETQWHNVVAWGKVAEILEKYTEVGSKVAVEGKLVNKQYTDKSGTKRYSTEVQISELLLLGGKNVEASN
jgi:single-strand DNA-binding protein